MNEVNEKSMSTEELWDYLKKYEGRQFYTSKGLPFKYTIRGGEMFVDRREKAKSITRSTVFRAYEKIYEGIQNSQPVPGPKKLGLFGAPYIWSILMTLFPAFKP